MRTLFTLLATLALGPALFSAPKDFEGKIDFRMTEGKESHNVSFLTKGERLRIEMAADKSGEGAIVIHDFAKGEMLMLMPSEEMYMVMPIEHGKGAAAAKGKESNFEKTGRSETILGYACDEYVTTEGKETTELWCAAGLGVFRGMSKNQGRPSSSAWEQEAQRKGLFPLRMVTKNAKGKETSRMEATAIAPGKLSEKLFSPPEGYRKFEMPGFGQQFGR